MSALAPAGIARGPKVSELVARQIVDEIVGSKLQPGDRLPSESAMLAQYRVGRASLREALLLLEVLGLISRRPGRSGGPVVGAVRERGFADVATLYFRVAGITYRELIESRLILQPIVARLAAERQDPRMLARLERLVSRTPLVDLSDDRTYLELILEYQATVASVSGNPVLSLFAGTLTDIYAARLERAIAPAPGRPRVMQVHLAIAQAILDGDGPLAEELAVRHMTWTMKRIGRSLAGMLDQVVEWT